MNDNKYIKMYIKYETNLNTTNKFAKMTRESDLRRAKSMNTSIGRSMESGHSFFPSLLLLSLFRFLSAFKTS